ASRLDDDEPGSGEDRSAAAELRGEIVRIEVALEDLPPRAAEQQSLLPLLGFDTCSPRRVEHDQLRRHPPGLDKKARAFLVVEMAVEMTCENAFEGPVLERQLQRVADDVFVGSVPLASHLDHVRALVERDDRSGEKAREIAATGRDIESSLRAERS